MVQLVANSLEVFLRLQRRATLTEDMSRPPTTEADWLAFWSKLAMSVEELDSKFTCPGLSMAQGFSGRRARLFRWGSRSTVLSDYNRWGPCAATRIRLHSDLISRATQAAQPKARDERAEEGRSQMQTRLGLTSYPGTDQLPRDQTQPSQEQQPHDDAENGEPVSDPLRIVPDSAGSRTDPEEG
ncbi:unnamed protein product [Gadus morhua 'NCC']